MKQLANRGEISFGEIPLEERVVMPEEKFRLLEGDVDVHIKAIRELFSGHHVDEYKWFPNMEEWARVIGAEFLDVSYNNGVLYLSFKELQPKVVPLDSIPLIGYFADPAYYKRGQLVTNGIYLSHGKPRSDSRMIGSVPSDALSLSQKMVLSSSPPDPNPFFDRIILGYVRGKPIPSSSSGH